MYTGDVGGGERQWTRIFSEAQPAASVIRLGRHRLLGEPVPPTIPRGGLGRTLGMSIWNGRACGFGFAPCSRPSAASVPRRERERRQADYSLNTPPSLLWSTAFSSSLHRDCCPLGRKDTDTHEKEGGDGAQKERTAPPVNASAHARVLCCPTSPQRQRSSPAAGRRCRRSQSACVRWPSLARRAGPGRPARRPLSAGVRYRPVGTR